MSLLSLQPKKRGVPILQPILPSPTAPRPPSLTGFKIFVFLIYSRWAKAETSASASILPRVQACKIVSILMEMSLLIAEQKRSILYLACFCTAEGNTNPPRRVRDYEMLREIYK
jgi:hypothetical protein